MSKKKTTKTAPVGKKKDQVLIIGTDFQKNKLYYYPEREAFLICSKPEATAQVHCTKEHLKRANEVRELAYPFLTITTKKI
jgi:hypothetical protein